MIGRRMMMAGLGCLAAAGAAAALRPRERLSLLGAASLDALIPKTFGGWSVQPSQALVVPDDEGSLSARLYSQITGRVYARPDGAAVMLLVAYGDTQSDLLQLHRPETCYPAFGFAVTRSRPVEIPISGQAAVPARFLVASRSDREERILYWTRIGEHLPLTNREQRINRLEDQLAGLIPDGVLVRVSTLDQTDNKAIAHARDFARDMLEAMSPQGRRALVGTALASHLGGENG